MKKEDIEHLIELSNGSFYSKKKFRKIFLSYIKTGEDLLEFLYEVSQVRGFGQTIKKSVLNWIFTNDPFYVKKELCKSFGGFDGLTVLKLFHPKPIRKEYDLIFKEIKQFSLEKRNK